jgi:hypothetical protein
MPSSTQADANEQLSAYLSSTGFEDLPPEAIAATKRNIFDTVGVMLAGGGPHATARRIVEMLSRWGGEPSSTVIGHEIRLPSVAAAFANTAMAHQFDFDDTHDEAVAHPTRGTLGYPSNPGSACHPDSELSGDPVRTRAARKRRERPPAPSATGRPTLPGRRRAWPGSTVSPVEVSGS